MLRNILAYCARVSNPSNQDSEKFSGLIKYCIKHQHWSIFERKLYDSGNLNYQRTSSSSPAPSARSHIKNFHNGIDSSLLAETIPLPELERQDDKNRQNSIDDVDPFVVQKYEMLMGIISKRNGIVSTDVG